MYVNIYMYIVCVYIHIYIVYVYIHCMCIYIHTYCVSSRKKCMAAIHPVSSRSSRLLSASGASVSAHRSSIHGSGCASSAEFEDIQPGWEWKQTIGSIVMIIQCGYNNNVWVYDICIHMWVYDNNNNINDTMWV